MGLPRRYLNEGEEIVVELRPHWTFFAGPGVALVAALVLAVGVAVRVGNDYLTNAALAVVLAAVAWFAVRWAAWYTTTFVVTTDRLIHRHGVLTRRGKEIPLERLNDVSFSKTLLQRLVGAGDLVVESAGEQGQQVFDHFPSPEDVQNTIHRAIEAAQVRDAARPGAPTAVSPLDQLERLDDLRKRGVISQAEFDAKKAQLLDRL